MSRCRNCLLVKGHFHAMSWRERRGFLDELSRAVRVALPETLNLPVFILHFNHCLIRTGSNNLREISYSIWSSLNLCRWMMRRKWEDSTAMNSYSSSSSSSSSLPPAAATQWLIHQGRQRDRAFVRWLLQARWMRLISIFLVLLTSSITATSFTSWGRQCLCYCRPKRRLPSHC